MSKALKAVQAVIKRFYYEHHDKIKMETELTKEVTDARVLGFSETKHRVVGAIDFRIDELKTTMSRLPINDVTNHYMYGNRLDELETLRTFVKGMVVKVDE